MISKRPIDQKALDKFQQYLNKIPVTPSIRENRGLLIATLHQSQKIFGYLPQNIQQEIAKKLKLTMADVYGVISFYSFFTTTPPGDKQVQVCTGTACFVKGADKILSKLEEELCIKDGETRDDMKYSLNSLRCVGACSLAPVVIVNEDVYGDVTTKQIKKIIKD